MPQIKHELTEPWASHFQTIQQEIERQGQEILILRGSIALKQEEQNVLRKHASFLVGQLIVEAKLPPALDAYQLSPDGKYLLATVADGPKED